MNIDISVSCASTILLSDAKMSVVPKETNSRQHVWAPKEAEEKCSVLKCEPFDGAEAGRGWQMDGRKTTKLENMEGEKRKKE